MSQTILIIAQKEDAFFKSVEEAIFNEGFQTLTMRNLESVFPRMQVEIFAAIIFDATMVEKPQSFIERLKAHPFAATTPWLIIDAPSSNFDFFQGNKTILDQVFTRDEISPENIGEYLHETIKQSAKESKQGDLAHVLPPFALQGVVSMGIDGAISFVCREQKRIVYLNEGRITFASSNRPEDLFGQFLIRQGLINDDQLHDIAAFAKDKGVRIGQAAVDKGHVSADRLFPLLEEHIRQIILPIFTWDQGSYSYLPGEEPNKNEAIFSLSVSQVLLQGVKKSYSEHRLRQYFDRRPQRIIPNPSLINQINDLSLDSHECDLANLLSKPRTLSELTVLSALSAEATLQLLFAFLAMEICQFAMDAGKLKKVIKAKPKSSTPAEIRGGAPKVVPEIREVAQSPKFTQVQELPDAEKAEALKKRDPDLTPIELNPERVLQAAKKSKTKTPAMPKKQAKGLAKPIPPIVPPSDFRRGMLSGMLLGLVLLFGGYTVWQLLLPERQDLDKLAENQMIDQYSQGALQAYDLRKTSRVVETAVREAAYEEKPLNIRVKTKPHEPKELSAPPPVKPKLLAAKLPMKKLSPSPQQQYAKLLKQADKLYDEGNLDQARRHFHQALKIQPKNGDLLVKLANIHYDMDLEREALVYIKRALQYNKTNAEAHLVLGNIHLMNGRRDAAKRAYQYFLKYSQDKRQRLEVAKVLKKISS